MLKELISNILLKFGYEFCRVKDKTNTNENTFNVLALLLPLLNKNKIKFVQIGANDGITCDPIHTLINDTWSGIRIEPNPILCRKLLSTTLNSKIKVDNCAISNSPIPIKMYFPPNNLCGSIHKRSKANEYLVRTSTINLLFYNNDIIELDLFVTDTEGSDYLIIKQLLTTKVRPTIIQFEHFFMSNKKYKEVCQLLHLNKYKLVVAGLDTVCLLST